MKLFKFFGESSTIPLILILVFFVFFVYSISLNGGFKWDDHNLIENNYEIKTWSDTATIFTKNFHEFVRYYRPLQTLTYKLDYSLWQSNPRGYHLTNILLHLANTLLVFILIFLMTKNKPAAWVSAMFFACHPALAEPVNYISSRSDLLVALFLLLTFISFKLSELRREKLYTALSLGAFVLALLSKEIALIFPFVLLVDENLTLKNYKKTIPYFFLAFIFFLGRLLIIPVTTTHAFSPALLLSIPKAVMTYVLILILPLTPHKTWFITPIASPTEGVFILSVLGLIGLGFFAKIFFQRSKTAFLGLLWFFILLAPFATLLYLFSSFQAFPFSYAWVYTPALGAFLCLGALLPKNFGSKKIIPVILFTLLVISFSRVTMKYNALWAGSEVDFYKDIIENQPSSGVSVIYANIGRSYLDENKPAQALEFLKKAVEVNPNDLNALANIAMVYKNQKKYDEALKFFKKVIAIDPSHAKAFISIGAILAEEGRLDDAMDYYKKALVLKPRIAIIHYNLGLLYLKKNNVPQAIHAFLQTVLLDPANADAHYNLAILYAQSGQQENALKEYAIVKKLEPGAFRQTP